MPAHWQTHEAEGLRWAHDWLPAHHLRALNAGPPAGVTNYKSKMADGLSKPIHPFASPILVLLSYLRATSVHAASTATAGGQPPKLKVAGERSPSDSTLGIRENVWYYYRSSLALLARQYVKVKQGKLSLWEMVQVAAICGLLPALWLLTSKAHRGGEGTRDSIQSLWPSKGTERPSSSASRTKFSFAAKGSSGKLRFSRCAAILADNR